ncbi:hypothetical protein CR513_23887, partial [Mucuna pruriens]
MKRIPSNSHAKRGQIEVAFKTIFSLYEWLVMGFSLTNASSTFMSLVNHLLKDESLYINLEKCNRLIRGLDRRREGEGHPKLANMICFIIHFNTIASP